jgi:hypothetical protein
MLSQLYETIYRTIGRKTFAVVRWLGYILYALYHCKIRHTNKSNSDIRPDSYSETNHHRNWQAISMKSLQPEIKICMHWFARAGCKTTRQYHRMLFCIMLMQKWYNCTRKSSHLETSTLYFLQLSSREGSIRIRAISFFVLWNGYIQEFWTLTFLASHK